MFNVSNRFLWPLISANMYVYLDLWDGADEWSNRTVLFCFPEVGGTQSGVYYINICTLLENCTNIIQPKMEAKMTTYFVWQGTLSKPSQALDNVSVKSDTPTGVTRTAVGDPARPVVAAVARVRNSMYSCELTSCTAEYEGEGCCCLRCTLNCICHS